MDLAGIFSGWAAIGWLGSACPEHFHSKFNPGDELLAPFLAGKGAHSEVAWIAVTVKMLQRLVRSNPVVLLCGNHPASSA